jgi:phage shock protein PspC (stress-responsive transcriptional regulator)/uncharacterized integral membrane protein
MPKLHRSQTDKIIAGVCGGLAEFFEIDSTIIRLLFILVVALGGSGILVYLILWLLIPKNPQEPAIISEEKIKEFAQDLKEKAQNLKKEFQKETKPEAQEMKKRRGYLFGWILVILGALFLFNNFFPLSFGFYAVRYWPLLLVVVGLILISRADNK